MANDRFRTSAIRGVNDILHTDGTLLTDAGLLAWRLGRSGPGSLWAGIGHRWHYAVAGGS
ncbi:hypothetical protein X770_11830 [Mesorhizobium sp. LSJC269B00]|nr:hypothetical protein X770_11830 [Mesorhizobium sp. LSJC269B00]ESY41494.1 hypothetical protein X746_26025 [Mesorhizobium sp. LNJC380A00]ESZ08049.1 hypothetical protein X736_06585 [Mesorhizobium sp. L2C089B000]